MIKQYYLENPGGDITKAVIDVCIDHCTLKWRELTGCSSGSTNLHITESKTLSWAKIIFNRYSRFSGTPIWKEADIIEETI